MNFDFDDDQYAFQDSLSRMLTESFPLQADLSADQTRSARMWDALRDMGLFALLPPEDFGGVGLTPLDLALPMEELGKVNAPISLVHTLAATDLLLRFGAQAQKEALLPKLANGELRISIAWQEADAGFDLKDIRSQATHQTLQGEKILVPDAISADMFVVIAKTPSGKCGLYLIEASRKGVTVTPHQSIDPAAACCRVVFDKAAISDADSLCPASPETAALRLFDVAATFYAGMEAGVAGYLLDAAVAYAAQRVQFGKPIGAFQAIKHKAADMAVAIEGARSSAYYAFWAITENSQDRAKAVSMAKAFCGDAARKVCNDAIQIHGGMGFTWELGLHNYLRRLQSLEYGFGDATHHRERVVVETLAELGETSASANLHVA